MKTVIERSRSKITVETGDDKEHYPVELTYRSELGDHLMMLTPDEVSQLTAFFNSVNNPTSDPFYQEDMD